MALREFSDPDNRGWRVWDVSPESLHPATRAEDYLRDYLDGWLTFESSDGTAKCRLTPIPRDWEKASDAQLLTWLHAAESVRGDRGSAELEREQPFGAHRPRTRTFRYPGGRFWSVAEWTTQESPNAKRVLRFSSGSRSLELEHWPADWMTLADEELAALLGRSFPREVRESSESTPPQKRRSADL